MYYRRRNPAGAVFVILGIVVLVLIGLVTDQVLSAQCHHAATCTSAPFKN